MRTLVKKMTRLGALSLAALLVGVMVVTPASAAAIAWSGAATPTLTWATSPPGGNWVGGVEPGVADDVTFTNTGGSTTSAMTNEVAASTAINSLWYNQQSDTPFVVHATQIDAGQILTISGSTVFAPANNGLNGPYSLMAGNVGTTSTMNSKTVITGPGQLDVLNAGGDIVVSETTPTSISASSANAVLDLSGLATFNANIDQLLVGYNINGVSGTNYERPNGTLYLAQSNTITINNPGTSTNAGLVIGYAQRSANKTSTVYLGQTNTLYVTTALIGARRQRGTMTFNPAVIGSNPSVKMRGLGSTDLVPVPVSLIIVADNSDVNSGNQSDAIGNMDLTGGTADILATSIIIARSPSGTATGSRGAQGTLTFNAGAINTTGMIIGLQAGNWAVTSSITGIVNVAGTGNLIVGSSGLVLAQNLGTTGTAPVGTLNISGGSVSLGADIMDGGGASSINMTGGTLDMQGHFIGSLTAPIDSISLTNATLDNIVQINAGTLSILNNVTLQVTLTDPLVPGSTFDILNWVSKTGTTFSAVNLPALADGLSWDSSKLYVDGTIQIVPEPATLLLLIIAAGLGLMLKCNRRK
jgi:hypothetical protein